MRKEHAKQIERWAEYCRTHADWKQHLIPFIDSQILIANRFYRKLAKMEDGKEKIRQLRNY